MFNALFGLGVNIVGGFGFSSSTTVGEVVAREDLSLHLQSQRGNGRGLASLKAFVERCGQELVQAALQPSCGKGAGFSAGGGESSRNRSQQGETRAQKQTLFSENATELITFYLDAFEDAELFIRRVVAAAIRALGTTAPLPPLAARCFQRIILKAFDVDPENATAAIAAVLDEELLINIIRHISTNYVVCETVAALFETTRRDTGRVPFSTASPVFVEACVRLRLAEHLAAYMAVALRTESCQPYFSFWKELVKRGYNQTAGPVVDELMKYELLSAYVKDILQGCEESRAIPGAVPLAAQGVEVYHGIVALVRTSLVPAEVCQMYSMNAMAIAPIKLLAVYFRRFCDLIPLGGAAASSRLDSVRIALCALFAEVLCFRLRDTDRIIAESDFLGSLLAVSTQHPHCHSLSMLLQRSLLSIFSGAKAEAGNLLLQHVLATENSRRPGFLSECVGLCVGDGFQHTPLSALMAEAWQTLAKRLPLTDSCGALRHAIELFLTNEQLQGRIRGIERPITGEGFAAAVPGSKEGIRHRPTINYVSRPDSQGPSSFALAAPSSTNRGGPHGGGKRAGAHTSEEWPGASPGQGTAAPGGAISDAAFAAPEATTSETEDSVTVGLAWAEEVALAEAPSRAGGAPS
ncbi:hypothetical protein TraAM80_04684 [Trypanosoma rangeli]|uniref:Uncharacterized protein n=1 Tax=Trypanosoma rangeli TaxID=5698 RepID=A0A422NIB3_TRYRA|nr:uncharacterized protein TraAM80_04684 [Trypanosoma rangeli]RNF05210.1 hypothetical protein TraAM80_04684 [Trypanosoma rangeli]|eukprot:RNF05210.1 hypothetical protein TraAM80_04684 [Trypanosoma rangeli]